jgi:hypothetical protein
MARDVAEIVEEYLSDDPTKWGKLASNVQWRRLQLLLLREILVELRKLNLRALVQEGKRGQEPRAE